MIRRENTRDSGGGRGVHSEEVSGELAGECERHTFRILVHRAQLVHKFAYKQPNTLKGMLISPCGSWGKCERIYNRIPGRVSSLTTITCVGT